MTVGLLGSGVLVDGLPAGKALKVHDVDATPGDHVTHPDTGVHHVLLEEQPSLLFLLFRHRRLRARFAKSITGLVY